MFVVPCCGPPVPVCCACSYLGTQIEGWSQLQTLLIAESTSNSTMLRIDGSSVFKNGYQNVYQTV